MALPARRTAFIQAEDVSAALQSGVEDDGAGPGLRSTDSYPPHLNRIVARPKPAVSGLAAFETGTLESCRWLGIDPADLFRPVPSWRSGRNVPKADVTPQAFASSAATSSAAFLVRVDQFVHRCRISQTVRRA